MRLTTLLLALVWVFFSCKNDKPETDTPVVDTPPSQNYKVPAFGADSAYAYVARQVAFGPRVPNTDGHKQCKEWLVATFKSFGAEVTEQDFEVKAYTGTTLNATNIIASYNPKARKRIILAAHWDTRHIADSPINGERVNEPILGADDGGSGVGVLLEIARQLQANPIAEADLGVDIILFDAEDHGQSGGDYDTYCLGSQHWSKNPHVPGYQAKYGILLDMVGAAAPRFTKDRVSMSFAGDVMNRVWKLAAGMGYGDLFVDVPTGELIDDHYFVNTIARIPMIDIINRPTTTETGFVAHWHTHNDTMEAIDKGTLRSVGQVLLAVVYREASGTF